jgi:hypothetical protein
LKLTRRSLLIGAGASAAAAALGGHALAQRPLAVAAATPVRIRATPIRHLSVTDRDRTRFGALVFRSGLVLESELAAFGGLSGLWRSSDGQDFVALTDNSQWLKARVETDDEGRLSGLRDAVMAPLLFADGRPFRRTRYYDTEGLAIAGGIAYVTSERTHAAFRFDWARAGVKARGQLLALPMEARRMLPRNGGLEAIGAAPARSPLAGALVAIAERSEAGAEAPTLGLILTGAKRGTFRVARSENFDVTDLAFLPNGEMLLLERSFSLFGGLGARIRRIPAGAVRPGALVDGPVIFRSDPSQEMDNMEGMALHRDGGQTVVTLISDDNFGSLQRTLLLEFFLDP